MVRAKGQRALALLGVFVLALDNVAVQVDHHARHILKPTLVTLEIERAGILADVLLDLINFFGC